MYVDPISSRNPATTVAVAYDIFLIAFLFAILDSFNFFRIHLDSGSKFIHLRSIHTFQNNTQFNLQLGLIDRSTKLTTSLVAPNELYCVPVGTKFESLKFRPVDVMTQSFLGEG